VLLPQAAELTSAAEALPPLLTEEVLRCIVALIPDEWLAQTDAADEPRNVYFEFLKSRLAASAAFVEEALHARERLV
jgi:hypothetical protein